jgi:hypothetical protein
MFSPPIIIFFYYFMYSNDTTRTWETISVSYPSNLVYTVHISWIYNYMRAREFKLPEYIGLFAR